MSAAVRWHVKKAARRGVALGAWLTGGGAARRMPGIRVLTYHAFGGRPRDPFCLPVADFAAQMAYLAEHRLAVSLARFERFLDGSAAPPAGSVLVTIDDGLRSLHREALPVLREYRVPAVAFVSAGLIAFGAGDGTRGLPAPGGEAYLSWDELGRLSEAGVAIGSHSWSHRSLASLAAGVALEEAVSSRETLERRLGTEVRAFAYPFGTRADFNEQTARLLSAAGYRCAFTSQHGLVTRASPRLSLPRIKVEGGDAPWLFPLLVRGGLDPWRWIDLTCARWQASGG